MGEGRPDPQGGREEGMLSLEEESFLLREIGLVSRGIGEKLRDSREMIRIFRARVSSSTIKTARSVELCLLMK